MDSGQLAPHLREDFERIMRSAVEDGTPLRDLLQCSDLSPAEQAAIAEVVTPGAGQDCRG